MDQALPSEQQFALQFARTLARYDYEQAYALTMHEYQQHVGLAEVRQYFESVIPDDWGPIDPIYAVGDTFTDFPDRQSSDVGWVYVSLEGTVYPYTEGLYILVAHEDNELKIRDV